MIRKYCKAYYLKDLRQWKGWTERHEEGDEALTDESVVYLWDDFVNASAGLPQDVSDD